MTKQKIFTSAQPAEHKQHPVAKRLKLGLQFFADGEGAGNNNSAGDNNPPGDGAGGDGSGSGAGDGAGNGDGDGDGEGDDDLPLDLKELMATYPEIKAQVDKEKERAVKRRFRNKDKDPDPSKKPPGDNAGGSDDETGQWKSKAEKLETKAKEYAFAAHVAGKGLNSKMLKALAANEVRSLQLNDDGELDPDDVEDVLDHLRVEFPDAFKTTTTATDDQTTTTTTKKRNFNSGPNTQRTNEQNQQQVDVRKDMEARLADMKKRNMI